ncbi:MAG: hypothetical protein M3081_18120 [Gemmatimonadota bacterium]|nr:hypothetical protein [Gemmatimonadota bacterium]
MTVLHSSSSMPPSGRTTRYLIGFGALLVICAGCHASTPDPAPVAQRCSGERFLVVANQTGGLIEIFALHPGRRDLVGTASMGTSQIVVDSTLDLSATYLARDMASGSTLASVNWMNPNSRGAATSSVRLALTCRSRS